MLCETDLECQTRLNRCAPPLDETRDLEIHDDANRNPPRVTDLGQPNQARHARSIALIMHVILGINFLPRTTVSTLLFNDENFNALDADDYFKSRKLRFSSVNLVS